MKRGTFLIMLILGAVSLFAQDFYTIQIRSLSRETPLTMEELQTGMWQHKVEGKTKCFFGRFGSYDEAKKALDSIKKDKYPGAFVISSDKIFKTSGVTTGAVKSTPKKEKTEAVTQKESKPVAQMSTTVDNIEIYSIQVAAYRYPLYTKDFGLEEKVMEFYCSDNLYRYLVGKYDDKDDAYKELEKIRKSGYPDAFLVDYKKYEVYRIE